MRQRAHCEQPDPRDPVLNLCNLTDRRVAGLLASRWICSRAPASRRQVFRVALLAAGGIPGDQVAGPRGRRPGVVILEGQGGRRRSGGPGSCPRGRRRTGCPHASKSVGLLCDTLCCATLYVVRHLLGVILTLLQELEIWTQCHKLGLHGRTRTTGCRMRCAIEAGAPHYAHGGPCAGHRSS